MDSSLLGGTAPSDVYRVDGAYDDVASSDDGSAEAEETMRNDVGNDSGNDNDGDGGNNMTDGGAPSREHLGATDGGSAAGAAMDGGANAGGGGAQRVSFDVYPSSAPSQTLGAPTADATDGAMEAAPASMIHFRDPKRHGNGDFSSPYPTQSLRQRHVDETTDNEAPLALEEMAGGATPAISNVSKQSGRHAADRGQTSSSEEARGAAAAAAAVDATPAFLRRAAQDMEIAKRQSRRDRGHTPPNSLINADRRMTAPSALQGSNIDNIPKDSSFFGADASALDGTFVSIRDLNDDDDVPSVDDDRWNKSLDNASRIGAQMGGTAEDDDFPTESTSLLGATTGNKSKSMLSWQGGFFGSQIEREDRRERRRMVRARRRGRVADALRALRSAFVSGDTGGRPQQRTRTGADVARNGGWEARHPIGSDFVAQRAAAPSSPRRMRRRGRFSAFLTGALCFHMALCALHDLFLRYLSYRNPSNYEDGGDAAADAQQEASIGWNGEGQYVPAYWMTFDGRVLNPLLGPGARTLTASGALVPGLVVNRGQAWRMMTSLFETSSFVELALHVWVLRSVVGGGSSSKTGLESKRRPFVVVALYVISALIGSVWSMAVDQGRLVTSSGMGVAGLLAAATVEGVCFPMTSKDEEDNNTITNGNQGSSGPTISSTSNEQFTFQPPHATKKKRHMPLSDASSSPTLLLFLEMVVSWWAAYSSLVGIIMAAATGVACALLLFVGRPPPGHYNLNDSNDLFFGETPPPPPSRYGGDHIWREDDDSADTSIGSERQHFQTPLMRRSILADEDDEEIPMNAKSSLRKRNVSGGSSSSAKTPLNSKGQATSVGTKPTFSASRVIARLVGVLLALLLTLIPASLIATGEGPSKEATRAAQLGCKPMRILYKQDGNGGTFECAGGCIPLSREHVAHKKEGMHVGRCDTIGYRCWQQSGKMTLRNYDANVGIYVLPSEDGSCDNNNDDDGNNINGEDDQADNNEVEEAQ